MQLDFLSAFVTLLVTVDPLGLIPVFLAVTQGAGRAQRNAIAAEAGGIAFGILAGAALFGEWLLTHLGISMASFRIAGGLLLFAIAFEMTFGQKTTAQGRHRNGGACASRGLSPRHPAAGRAGSDHGLGAYRRPSRRQLDSAGRPAGRHRRGDSDNGHRLPHGAVDRESCWKPGADRVQPVAGGPARRSCRPVCGRWRSDLLQALIRHRRISRLPRK